MKRPPLLFQLFKGALCMPRLEQHVPGEGHMGRRSMHESAGQHCRAPLIFHGAMYIILLLYAIRALFHQIVPQPLGLRASPTNSSCHHRPRSRLLVTASQRYLYIAMLDDDWKNNSSLSCILMFLHDGPTSAGMAFHTHMRTFWHMGILVQNPLEYEMPIYFWIRG